MSERWYSRPVIAVADAARALRFYGSSLNFIEDWRYEEGDRLVIVQVSRGGCQLILSEQWPQDAGKSRVFVELAEDDFRRLMDELKAGRVPYEVVPIFRTVWRLG